MKLFICIVFIAGAHALRSQMANRFARFAIPDSINVNPNVNKCWTDGNDLPVQWFDDGTEIVRGRYWYQCTKGTLQPIGCISDSKQRIKRGDSYVDDGFEYRCVLDTEGYLYFEATSCVTKEGTKHQPGDTWDHPDGKNYWFICSREYLYKRPYLAVKTQGCIVGPSRLRIKINETHEENDSWYSCLDNYNSTSMCLRGCVVNGTRKKAGEAWESGTFQYTCVKKDDRCVVECVGCKNGDRVLRSGDRYMRDNSVVQCSVLQDPDTQKISAAHKVVGCVERDRRGAVVGERVIGCRWAEKNGDYKYEKTCGESGQPDPVGCILTKDGYDYLFVPPNSYTVHHPPTGEAIYLACRATESGNLDHFSFTEADLADPLSGRLRGLKYAVPRGK